MLGCVIALTLAIAFWLAVLPYVTLSAWQLAVLPGAFIGSLAAWLAKSSRKPVFLAAITVTAIISALFGEWAQATYQLRTRLREQGVQAQDVQMRQLLQAKILEHQMREELSTKPEAEKDLPQDSEATDEHRSNEEIASVRDAPPPFEPAEISWTSSANLALRFYFSSFRHQLLGFLLSIGLSIFGAIQAARIVKAE